MSEIADSDSYSFETCTKSTKSSSRSNRASRSTSRKSSKDASYGFSYKASPDQKCQILGPALSSSDMRKKLFASFRSRGLLENVKSQLRTNLASAIKESDLHKSIGIQQETVPDNLTSSIADYLVAEHLKQAKYEYALSVFRTETVSSSLHLNFADVLKFLKIDPNSKIHNELLMSNLHHSSKSFLCSFLSVLISKESRKVSEYTQTEKSNVISTGNIERKMMDIEEEMCNKAMKELVNESGTLETKLMEFQRKLEKEKKAQLADEVQAFKTKELIEMRMHEKEAARREIEKARSEVEKRYKNMLDKIHEKERKSEELIHMRQTSLDQEAFRNRQQMLSDLESLKARENEIKRNHELAIKELDVEKAQVKALSTQLSAKELSLKSLENQYESKLQEKILNMKLERQEEEQNHRQYLRAEETKLENEKIAFESQKASMIKYNDDYEKLKGENAQLQMSLQTAMKKVSQLTQKSDDVNERLREFADYHSVKEKSMILAKELELCKQKLTELKDEKDVSGRRHNKTVKDLIDKLAKGHPDNCNSSKKFDEEKCRLIEKERQLTDKCQLLEKKLHAEVRKNKEINQLYDDKILQQRASLREIAELKALVKKFQNKQSFPTHSVPSSAESTAWRSRDSTAFSSTVRGRMPGNISQSTNNRSPISSGKTTEIRQESSPTNMLGLTYVRDSKEVFKMLEKESAELEQSYFNYQQRLRLQENNGKPNNGKPNTNDYTPLERYSSTIHTKTSGIMPGNNLTMNIHNALTSRTADLATYSTVSRAESSEEDDWRLEDRQDKLKTNNSEQNSWQIKGRQSRQYIQASHQRFGVIEEESFNMAPGKIFLDTLQSEYLTEQPLPSAINEKDGGRDSKVLSQHFQSSEIDKIDNFVQQGLEIDDCVSKSLQARSSQPQKLADDSLEMLPDESTLVRPEYQQTEFQNLASDEVTALPSQLPGYLSNPSHGNLSTPDENTSIRPDLVHNHQDSNETRKTDIFAKQNDADSDGHGAGENEEVRAPLRTDGQIDGQKPNSKIISQSSVKANYEIENGFNARDKIDSARGNTKEMDSGGRDEHEHIVCVHSREDSLQEVTQEAVMPSREILEMGELDRRDQNISATERERKELDSSEREGHNLQQELDRSEREKLLAYERERLELERLEREELEQAELSASSEAENISSCSIEHLQEDEINETDAVSEPEASKDNDEVKIDPLMKHYMQMLLKKKQEEPTSPEKEDLNLTDDSKIGTRFSLKSDLSDLVEDQLENIEGQSDEDFDW